MTSIKSFLYQLFFLILKRLNLAVGSKQFAIIFDSKSFKYHKYFKDYFYDIERYINYASPDETVTNKSNLLHRIIAHYHVIEKGLSMPEPRLGFGEELTFSLITLLERYIYLDYLTSNNQFQSAISVLNNYLEFHNNYQFANPNIKDKASLLILKYQNPKVSGGSKLVTKNEYIQNCKKDFSTLAKNRYSIRNFSEEAPDINLIIDSIDIARKTPSVCNRQSWSTIIIKNTELIEKVLNVHSGNRGFGHLIKTLIVIKSDLRSFLNAEERNQAFIDSGMYGMSLVYALNYNELGNVVLNWATTQENDLELRKALAIQDYEVVSMLIGVGCLKDEFQVPYSYRKSLEEFYSVF